MKTRNRKGGYSVNTANEYIDNKQGILCLSTELEAQIKFEDGQPTGEIIAYKAWFSQKDFRPLPSNLNPKWSYHLIWHWYSLIIFKPAKLALTSTSKLTISRRSNNDE